MASAFCWSDVRLVLEGQLILATDAIQAPRNSLLIAGKSTRKFSSTFTFDGTDFIIGFDGGVLILLTCFF